MQIRTDVVAVRQANGELMLVPVVAASALPTLPTPAAAGAVPASVPTPTPTSTVRSRHSRLRRDGKPNLPPGTMIRLLRSWPRATIDAVELAEAAGTSRDSAYQTLLLQTRTGLVRRMRTTGPYGRTRFRVLHPDATE